MNVDLNIFSNVASADPSACLVPQALRSIRHELALGTVAGLRVRAFVDPNPNPACFDAWCAAIGAADPRGGGLEIVQSSGLADGVKQALLTAQSDFAILWEHDFVFVPGRVRHSLSDVIEHMRRLGINHLRFNKRRNRVAGYDHLMRPNGDPHFPACRVSGRSNNPQIVDVGYYRRLAVPLIDSSQGRAHGLEGQLCGFIGGGHVYGDLGDPAVVRHLDGRDIRLADRWRRRLYLWTEKSYASN